MTEMVCRELVDVVTAYIEGTLPQADRVRFEAHLAECPFCTDYVAQMRATITMLGRADAEALAPAARADIVAAFRHWRD